MFNKICKTTIAFICLSGIGLAQDIKMNTISTIPVKVTVNNQCPEAVIIIRSNGEKGCPVLISSFTYGISNKKINIGDPKKCNYKISDFKSGKGSTSSKIISLGKSSSSYFTFKESNNVCKLS